MLSIAMFGEVCIIIMVHPVLLIEEKAIIFRICVWLIPAIPPISMEISPIVIRIDGSMFFDVMYISVVGAIFCHVDISIDVCSIDPCITSGSQKCTGAAPIFVARATAMIAEAYLLFSCVMSQVPSCHALIVPENRIMVDAIACVRKYFVVAS